MHHQRRLKTYRVTPPRFSPFSVPGTARIFRGALDYGTFVLGVLKLSSKLPISGLLSYSERS